MEQQNQQLQSNDQPPAQQPVEQPPVPIAPSPSNQVPMNLGLEKAWKKIKIAAIILISTASLGLLLAPLTYTSYMAASNGTNVLAWNSVFAIGVVIQIVLLIMGIKLLNKNRTLGMSLTLQQRLLLALPIALSFFFVSSPIRFANIVAGVLIALAFADMLRARKKPPLA